MGKKENKSNESHKSQVFSFGIKRHGGH